MIESKDQGSKVPTTTYYKKEDDKIVYIDYICLMRTLVGIAYPTEEKITVTTNELLRNLDFSDKKIKALTYFPRLYNPYENFNPVPISPFHRKHRFQKVTPQSYFNPSELVFLRNLLKEQNDFYSRLLQENSGEIILN